MADDITLQIGTAVDFAEIKAQGDRIGRDISQGIEKSAADVGPAYKRSIEKARTAFKKFQNADARLDMQKLVPSKEWTSIKSNIASATQQYTSALSVENQQLELRNELEKQYADMVERNEKARRQHKKKPVTQEDFDKQADAIYRVNRQYEIAKQKTQKWKDTVDQLTQQEQNLDLFQKFAPGDQIQKNRTALLALKQSLEDADLAIITANQHEQEFITKQELAAQKAREVAEAKERAAQEKQEAQEAREKEREAQAYAKATSELQRYIDKAREETATLEDVRNAISGIISRMAELETQPTLSDAQTNEYERLGNTLAELTEKYDLLKRSGNVDALKQSIDKVTESVKKLLSHITKLAGSAIKNAFNSVRRSISGVGGDSRNTSREIQSLIRNIVKYGFGVRSLYFLYKRLRSAITDALKEMAKVDTHGLGQAIANLSSSLSYLRNAWAAAFSPIIQYVAPVLVYLMDLLADVGNAIAALFATLTGKGTVVKAVKQQKSLADALGDTGSAAGGAADALGKLADFDELNIIGNDSGGGGGGGGGGGAGDNAGAFVVETIENELSDLINAGKWFEIGQLFADKLNTLTEAADKWLNDVFRPWGVKWATNLGNFMNGFIYHYDWELLGKTFADALNAIFDISNTWLTTVNWEWFGTRVADGLISAFQNIDAELIGQALANKLNKTIDFVYGFVKELFMNGNAKLIGDRIAEGFYNFFSTIHWDKAFEAVSTGFNGVFKSFRRFIDQFNWDEVGDAIANAFNTAVNNIDAKKAGKAINDFVFRVLDQLQKLDLFAVGAKIGQFLSSIDWVDIILGVVDDILELVRGVIYGAFTGEYGAGLAGIIVGGLATSLLAAFAKIKFAELIGGQILKGALSSAGLGTVGAEAGGTLAGIFGTGISGATIASIASIAAALGGVVIMLKQSSDWLDQYNTKLTTLDETTQRHVDELDLLIEQTNGYHDASVRQMGVYETENDRVRELADSYLDLFDKNGKVKEGMQTRADYYFSQLAGALNMEEDQLKNIISKNGDLRTSIEEIITAKTQDRAISAYLDEYQFALENTKTAQDAVTNAEADLERALRRRDETAKAVDKAQEEYLKHIGDGVEIEAKYKQKLDDAIAAHSNAEYAVARTTEEIERANDELLKINATAEFYEGYIAAIATNDTNLINAALKRMQDGFITAEEGDKASLMRQANNMRDYYTLLLTEMEKGNPNVTKEMLEEAKGWVDAADKELGKLNQTGKDAMDDLKAGMSSKKQALYDEATATGQSIASAYRNSLAGVLNGVDMGTPTASLPTYSYQSTSGNITPKRNGYARLATGAVLPPNDPFLAIVGDQKHGTNIEAPLSTIEDAVRNVVGDSNYNPEVVQLLQELIEVVRSKNFSLSRKEVATAVVKEINNERKRTGNTPILG